MSRGQQERGQGSAGRGALGNAGRGAAAVLALAVLGALAWGQAPPLPAAPPETPLAPSGVIQAYGGAGPDDPIGPGDVVDVRVFDQSQLDGTARVGADDSLDLPFLGAVPAGGETTVELQHELELRYGALLRHPLVSVRVVEVNSRRVAVTGEVARPGVYAFSGRLTLLQALAMAGGIDPLKAGTVLYWLHAAPAQTVVPASGPPRISIDSVLETVDIRQLMSDPTLANRRVWPGDTIAVPQAQRVFITGDVVRSGDIPLQTGFTLGQAVSMAGGPLAQADPRHVRILRRVPGQTRPQVIMVNLVAINHGQAPDVRLQANDIAYVPESGLRDVGLGILDFFSGAGRWRVQSAAGVY